MEETLQAVMQKIKHNMAEIGTDLREFPGTHDGMYFRNRENCIGIGHIFNWTQSFFTGMAYWSYVYDKDSRTIDWMKQFLDGYEAKVLKTPMETMHDTGFLYSLYAAALYRLTGEERVKKVGLLAADALAHRFVPNGGYIRAWGRMDDTIPAYVSSELAKDHFFTESRGLAIVDCMMNLPLLFWAAKTGGDARYAEIAKAHADMTLQYFVREDDSVCHAYRFDGDGTPLGEENYCGFSKESRWARGTAWAIYGYAICYSYTKDKRYLDVSERLATFFCKQLRGDGAVVWDFSLPPQTPAIPCGKQQAWMTWDITDKKNESRVVDTSASAIALCGIQEILRHRKNAFLQKSAKQILDGLTENYLCLDETVNGILKCQNGNETMASYGDYFMIEAMMNASGDYGRIW